MLLFIKGIHLLLISAWMWLLSIVIIIVIKMYGTWGMCLLHYGWFTQCWNLNHHVSWVVFVADWCCHFGLFGWYLCAAAALGCFIAVSQICLWLIFFFCYIWWLITAVVLLLILLHCDKVYYLVVVFATFIVVVSCALWCFFHVDLHSSHSLVYLMFYCLNCVAACCWLFSVGCCWSSPPSQHAPVG